MTNNNNLNLEKLINEVKNKKNIQKTKINFKPEIIQLLENDISKKLFRNLENYIENKK